jgi:hypothetical protein
VIWRRDAAARSVAEERRRSTSRDVQQWRMGTGRDAAECEEMKDQRR